jgi:seryl-tRNA synthetase
MSRAQIERAGFLKSFPNLLGCVCTLHGTEAEIGAAVDPHAPGEAWTAALSAADLVLTPAACYPVYPLVAGRGPVPDDGLLFDVAADCFRREPSREAHRMQSFRMREYVRIGRAEQVVAFRSRWIARAQEMAEALALPCRVAAATDPFFGRLGQVRGIVQLQQSLKFELLVSTWALGEPTACMSFNYHQDHFGTIWDLRGATGDAAHTACVAFGMDRLAVALFCHHGLDTQQWPAQVRQTLGFA